MAVLSALCVLAIVERAPLRAKPGWLYVEQIVTGNWSSSQPPEIGDTAFVIGLIAAVAINFAPLLAIVGAILALLERKTDMNLVNAFASRDLTIETAIVRNVLSSDLIPSDKREDFLRRIRASIDEARQDWFGPLLDEKFGTDQAERIRARMKEIDIAP